MNIQEAILSNRRIKRPSHAEWVRVEGSRIIDDNGVRCVPSVDDLLADDWEIEPIMISRERFMKIRAEKQDSGWKCSHCGEVPIESLLMELGL